MSIIAEKRDKLSKKNLHLSCVPRKDTTLLKVNVSSNEVGIIHRVSAVLFFHGWDILEAMAETSQEGYVQDVFVVRSPLGEEMTESKLFMIREDLHSLFYGGVSVFELMGDEFVEKFQKARISDPTAVVRLYNPMGSDFTVMDIRMKDRPGILFQITQILHLLQIDIVTFSAITDNGIIRDSFLIQLESGGKLDESTTFPQLKNAIENIL